ncbi:MAG: type I DNA topoisomerase [Candidatus Kapaibacterium sp.]|nr:type I DNA topoisomerase [Ignavibacteriota bacterium]MCB9221604.1 type I DNA topoisomerase [Ignavibacteria bacterium]
MPKSLVIVESPAKAKTIEKYLDEIEKGKFIVKSSIGHIRDLAKKDMSIDIDNGFEPKYEISPDKKKTVTELKKLSKQSDTVWLATDEDREGEAIAWHLLEALGLDESKTKRIVFNEITKKAIQKAIENPRSVNKELVDAQQARRILDRLVGYELSPVLWKKVKYGLSAGRVQSVAVRIIVEREREIENHKPEITYKLVGDFVTEGGELFKAELKEKFENKEDALAYLNSAVGQKFYIKDLKVKPGKRSPQAPFTTSKLQQEASAKLGFSVKQTMVVAQKLYEAGMITYMRTDSTNLSEDAISSASNYITSNFGDKYLEKRLYKTSSKGAQEAHEAIRPTDLSKPTINTGNNGQDRLYELIWKRTMASQMSDAQLERTTADIGFANNDTDFVAKGEVIKFDGFLKVYPEVKKDGKILPAMAKNQKLEVSEIVGRETFSRPPARYTEATLVRTLEEMGIGRPSTYAPTISTIQNREYVEKTDRDGYERKYVQIALKENKVTEEKLTEITGQERNKLFPTDVGKVVTDFLVKHFTEIVDFDFTKNVEEEFDKIAEGQRKWNEMISNFYTGFHETIEKSEDISKKDAINARMLGNDPKTGRPIYARIGRYGAMLQMGENEDEEKPRFASLMPSQSIETITLEEALEMFKLPRVIGQNEDGKDIKTNVGRFGPYVQLDKTYASITHEEIFTITLEEAIQKIKDKIEQKNKNKIQEFDDGIKVLNGRFGPYVTDGKVNAKIPKDKTPEDLTHEECKALIAEAPAKKGRGRTTKAATKKPATKKPTAKKKPAAKKSSTKKK